jgi:hypothetical protein
MLNYYSPNRKIFANGKELVSFEYDETGTPIRAVVMQSFVACNYSIEVDPVVVSSIGGPSFQMPGLTTARLELVSHGPLQIEEGSKAVELEQRLQSAWNLPVSELLKIVYQKMEGRES